MRIVSLLPSLTELVCALGHEHDLVGVSHECDFPPIAELIPRLTSSRIDPGASAQAIDQAVSEQGGSLYTLDQAKLAHVAPDLILTQAQCDVCAVNEESVKRIAASLTGSPHVETVNPSDLKGVKEMFLRIGSLLSPAALDQARELCARFDRFEATIKGRKERPIPVLIHLEWIDPPFTSGHWTPDLVSLAGGYEPLARSGERSRRCTWGEISSAKPEILLVAPCGFSLDRTRQDWTDFTHSQEAAALAVLRPRVVLADGNSYFSRPGPRLLDSLKILAAAIDPENFLDQAPTIGWETWDHWGSL